jgi:hypothetical protein
MAIIARIDRNSADARRSVSPAPQPAQIGFVLQNTRSAGPQRPQRSGRIGFVLQNSIGRALRSAELEPEQQDSVPAVTGIHQFTRQSQGAINVETGAHWVRSAQRERCR